MEKYVIVMDVSGDISEDFAAKMGIKFVPMQYSLGDEMRTSYGIESADVLKKFYDGQRNGDLTKTSQITPYMYEEFFTPIMEEGYSVLYMSLSSGLSATYNSACLAKQILKEKFPNLDLYPVDTLAATGGIGLLVERAVQNKEKGMTIEDNYNDIINIRPKLRHWLLVQDLMYLKRGGRVSATKAVFGSMLNIKPILKLDEVGKLQTIEKKRGNKAAVKQLFNYFVGSYNPATGNTVYICDGDCRDLANDLANMIKEKYPEVIIKQTTLCPIIGAHTGPGLVVICHFA